MPARSLAAVTLAAALAANAVMAQVNCPTSARVAVGVTPPPPLAEQVQPPIPGYGYVWTPGYWAWNPAVNDYYWAPGVWVLPPRIGYLWTPPWWGWDDGVYVFNAGYWGPTIGWYGGIDYGYGYYGHGYEGGYWRGNTFWYNRGVNNFGGARFNAVYDRPHLGRNFSHVSYNGGPGGLRERPTPQELAASRDPHLGPTPGQASHVQAAAANTAFRAGPNHGHPILAAAGGAAAGALAVHALTHRGGQGPAGRATAATHGPERFAGRAPIHAGSRAGGGYAEHRAVAGAGPRVQAFRAPTERAAPSFHVAPSFHAARAFHAAPAGRPMAVSRGGGEGRRR